MSTYWLFRYLNTGPFHVTKFKSHYLAVSRKVCWKISTLVFSSPELKGLFPPNLAQSVLCNWLMMFKFVWKKGLPLSIKKIHVKATLLKSFLLEPCNYYFNHRPFTGHMRVFLSNMIKPIYHQSIHQTISKSNQALKYLVDKNNVLPCAFLWTKLSSSSCHSLILVLY